jgi:hypothetical protein
MVSQLVTRSVVAVGVVNHVRVVDQSFVALKLTLKLSSVVKAVSAMVVLLADIRCACKYVTE